MKSNIIELAFDLDAPFPFPAPFAPKGLPAGLPPFDLTDSGDSAKLVLCLSGEGATREGFRE